MNKIIGSDELNEEQEVEILDEMWKKQFAGLDALQDNLTNMISQAEQIGKKFNTHHRGMRFSINSIENLKSDLSELQTKHDESHELLRLLTNRNKGLF